MTFCFFIMFQFGSFTQSCPTLWTPWTAAYQAALSITNSWSLLKLMSTESVMPSNHLILCCPLSFCLQSFLGSGCFPKGQFFASGGQSVGVSASASVFPMNVQGLLPLGWTGWISLQFRGLSRVFFNTTAQSISSPVLSFLYGPTLTSIHDHDYWKNHSPGSSAGKESSCHVGDPGSIPGSGRCTGEGIGYPLQYWISLAAQLVKNLPAMQETWVRSLGWEDPLVKETAIHSNILAWRIPWTVQNMGLQRVGHD